MYRATQIEHDYTPFHHVYCCCVTVPQVGHIVPLGPSIPSNFPARKNTPYVELNVSADDIILSQHSKYVDFEDSPRFTAL
jgi:hypothetical protein